MRIISCCNQKGGVSKTTTCVNIAAGLSKRGYHVLLIDIDPQANATSDVIGFAEPDTTIYDVLIGRTAITQAIKRGKHINIDLVPSSIELSGAEVELVNAIGAQTRLRRSLVGLPDYDYVLIDSPPNLGLLTINALAASGEVIIPVAGGTFALRGLAQLINTIREVRIELESPVDVLGIVATTIKRTNVSRDIESTLREQFGDLVFKTTVPDNVSVEEAHSRQQSVIDYAPDSKGAAAYIALTNEVIERG